MYVYEFFTIKNGGGVIHKMLKIYITPQMLVSTWLNLCRVSHSPSHQIIIITTTTIVIVEEETL